METKTKRPRTKVRSCNGTLVSHGTPCRICQKPGEKLRRKLEYKLKDDTLDKQEQRVLANLRVETRITTTPTMVKVVNKFFNKSIVMSYTQYLNSEFGRIGYSYEVVF